MIIKTILILYYVYNDVFIFIRFDRNKCVFSNMVPEVGTVRTFRLYSVGHPNSPYGMLCVHNIYKMYANRQKHT